MHPDMKTIAQSIDRDGEYVPDFIPEARFGAGCEHCHLERVLQNGLCRECRRLLAVGDPS
jgi:hypothetical protein